MGSMEDADTFAGHGVLISSGKVEYLMGDVGQIGLDGHEAVIAIDDDPRPGGCGEVSEGPPI